MTAQQVAQSIKAQNVQNDIVLIAIEGFGGSGKSTLAHEIKDYLKDAYVISIDDFIVKAKLTDSSWDNGVFDHQRLEKQVLIPATTGRAIAYQKLDWSTGTLSKPITVPRVRFLIIEGISSYHPSIAQYYTFKIWINTPIQIAKKRGHARDGGSENAQHWDLWAENDLKYQREHHPEIQADFQINNDDM